MATIIDALAVELELDPTKLKRGILDALEGLKQLKDGVDRHSKDINKQTKETAEGFGAITKKLGELALAYLSFTAIKSFVNDIVQQNIALNNQAAALGVSIEKLSAMNNMARLVGASAQGMSAALGSVQQQLVMMNQFHQAPSQDFLIGLQMLQMPRGSYLGPNVTPESFIFAAAQAARRQLRAGQSQAAVSQELQKLGIGDSGLIAAMTQQDPEVLRRYFEEMKKLAPTPESTKAAQDFNMELARLGAHFTKLGYDLLPTINQQIGPFLRLLEDIIKGITWLTSIKLPPWLSAVANAPTAPLTAYDWFMHPEHRDDILKKYGYGPPPGAGTGTPGGKPSGTPTPGADGPPGIPSEILAKAKDVALHGGATGVQAFMASQGYPMSGAWCGEFAAAVVTSAGGTPPKNPAIASNWRNWGSPVTGAPQAGDIAVRRGAPTGSTGSHVTIVENYDPRTGTFMGVGGNQGRPESRFNAGQYDFRRGTSEERTVKGSTFDDSMTALGPKTGEAGIALPDKSTLGQMFQVTTPDGRTFIAKQTDLGPARWTGRGVDINAELRRKMGYGEKNFPTDQQFKIQPYHPDSSAAPADHDVNWYGTMLKMFRGFMGAPTSYHPAMLHNQNVTHNNVSTAETHIGHMTVNTQATDARGLANEIAPMLRHRSIMASSNIVSGGPV